jgi:radical SAM family uncharacterized protein
MTGQGLDTVSQSEWEELLCQVRKPSRYIDNEVNAYHKDLASAGLRFALAFPDTYEIGMSHLGFRIIYELLNQIDGVVAERFFCPWTDMESLMRQKGLLLCSMESRVPLSRFDVVGFSIPYEMGYTNVINMLDLGGVPIESSQRTDPFPLVIAGGPCCVNPEPLSSFVDVFVVGEAEELLSELIPCLLKAKREGLSKMELLERLASIEGIYVPAFFDVRYDPEGKIEAISPKLDGHERVRRRIVRDLDGASYPTRWLIPFTRAVHDRVSLEIARGCVKGCRFCQAGFVYRPIRERSMQRLVSLADEALRETGYEEISLLSLSSGDYTEISRLLQDLVHRCCPQKIAVSFPSLRIGSLSDELVEMIKEVRKTGVTIAPEAGTERLRRVINKDIYEEEILETVKRVFHHGWLSVKLYFMIGLPTETQRDIEGIVELCDRILKEVGSPKARRKISVSIATFVPKPHTPFQWVGQLSLGEINERLRWLRKSLRKRGIQVKWQDPHLSILEGVFSRGDRRLSEVLKRAHELGCRFDGWGDQFRFDMWRKAFEDCRMNMDEYTTRGFSMDEVLPWSHIDIGVDEAFLKEEYHRALAEERTPDCRTACRNCGVCNEGPVRPVFMETTAFQSPFPGMRAFQGVQHRRKGREIQRRFRLKYAKLGLMRFLSHLEVVNVMTRAFRRANVPLCFSEGFHPLPKMDFGPALPVGIESTAEYLDFVAFGHISPIEILSSLKVHFPRGIYPLRCDEIPIDGPSLFQQRAVIRWMIEVPQEKMGEVDLNIESEAVARVELRRPPWIQLEVVAGPQGGVRILEIAGRILAMEQEEARRLRIIKTRVEFIDGDGG